MKILIIIFMSIPVFSIDYSSKENVINFINTVSKEYKINKKYLINLFKNIKQNIQTSQLSNNSIIYSKNDKIKNIKGEWSRYSINLIGTNRIINGVDFLTKYKITLNKIYKKYKVSPEYIVAIIGIESFYGSNLGKFYVFDNLVKLAFSEHRRFKFYKFELKELFKLKKYKYINIKKLIGSSSGAIGLGQFMPSTYNHFGIDFNNDNKIDMMNPIDTIASIANYFKEHNWDDNKPVAMRALFKGNKFTDEKIGLKYKYYINKLKTSHLKKQFNYKGRVHLIKLDAGNYDELWYGTKNFYTITRYNHSIYYAMAIFKLATAIKKSYIKKYKKYIINK